MCIRDRTKTPSTLCHEHRQPNRNISITPASRISLLERHQGVSARISKKSSTKSTMSQHDINSRLIITPNKPSTPSQPYVTNNSDSSTPMSLPGITKPSSHESPERQIPHHKEVSFHVSNASYQQSGQLQVIGQVSIRLSISSTSGHPSNQRQINVKSTSERHPHPKNSKSGERLTPIASDRPAPPGPRLWRGGKRSGNGATKGTSPGGAALGNSPQHGRCHHHAKQETAG